MIGDGATDLEVRKQFIPLRVRRLTAPTSLIIQWMGFCYQYLFFEMLLQARQPGGADLYICYGGVQLRESVAAKADWLVFEFKDLINSLE